MSKKNFLKITKLKSKKKTFSTKEEIPIEVEIENKLDFAIYVVTRPLYFKWDECENSFHVLMAEEKEKSFESTFFTPAPLVKLEEKEKLSLNFTLQFPMHEIHFTRNKILIPERNMIDPRGKFSLFLTMGYGHQNFEIPSEICNLRDRFSNWQQGVVEGPTLKLKRKD